PGELTAYNEYSDIQRTNRYAGAKIKKAETERVLWECRRQRLSAVLGKVDYLFTWYVKDRRRDPDNIMSAVKFVLDGLYKAGIIETDSQRHVGRIVHNPIEVDSANPRVEIQIDEHPTQIPCCGHGCCCNLGSTNKQTKGGTKQ